MAERGSYKLSELFSGNWNLFKEAVTNPKTAIVYDIDGILANSAKIVLRNFNEKFGLSVESSDIDGWDFLTNILKQKGFPESDIEHAKDDWYDASVLVRSQRNLYTRPLVKKTVNYYGSGNNFILTSRNSEFESATREWFGREFPEILPDNILIRKTGGADLADSAKFKVDSLKSLSEKFPWVIFIDDSIDFTKAVCEAGLPNCLVVNAPQGKIMPDFNYPNLFVVKRFPDSLQAMYPLMHAFEKALDG